MSSALRYIVFFLLLITAPRLFADDVTIKASAPNVVRQGERFRLQYTINAKPDNYVPPTIKHFNVLSGPSTSSSSNIKVINGNVERSYNYTLTYVLQAQDEGKHTIPPAVIKVKGKQYQSNALSVEVVKGKGSQSAGGGQGSNAGQSNSDIPSGNLFVRILVSDRDVYRDESLGATIKLYSKVNFAGLDKVDLPDFSGFYQQEIDMPRQSMTRENVNGEIYNTGIIKKYLLFPQQTGKVRIDPVELECIVRKAAQGSHSGSLFDQFFGRQYQNVKIKIKSRPVTINVKELPPNAPTSFKGAVGDYDMKVNIDKKELKANEALNLNVTLSGTGNIKLLDAPQIKFPPDFEAYDPEVNVSVNNSLNGAAGRKTFKYLVIPRHPGNFRIPPVAFSYFNPASGNYKTITSDEFNISVGKGDDNETGNVVTGFSKEDIKYLGKDIRYIKEGDVSWKRKNSYFITAGWFYVGYGFPFALLVLMIFFRRKKLKDRANVDLVKNRKANKLARKRLKIAHKHLKNDNKTEFYEEILKGLWGYISDKLTIPIADLSKDSAVATLKKYNIDQKIINDLTTVVDECEFARYAPTAELPQMDIVYEEAAKTISELEQNLK